MAGILCDFGYHKSNEDGSSVECFLIVKFSASVLEFSDRGLTERPTLHVRKIEAPLVRLRIVQAQRQCLDVPRRPSGIEFHEIGPAVPHLSDDSRAIIFNPGC